MGKQLDKWYRRYGRDSKSKTVPQTVQGDDDVEAPIVAAMLGGMMSNDDGVIDPQAFVEMNAMGADVSLADAVLLNMITDDGASDIDIGPIAATEGDSFDNIGDFDSDTGGDFGDSQIWKACVTHAFFLFDISKNSSHIRVFMIY